MVENDVWSINPTGGLIWTDGDTTFLDVSFDGTQDVWDVSAKQQAMRYNKVVLKGPGGLEATAEDADLQAASGQIHIFNDYRANITNQTDLNTLATQILTRQKTTPLSIQMSVNWETKGFLQPGYNITIAGSSIKYNESSSYIPAGNYRIKTITYHIKNGAYHYIELDLEDGIYYVHQTTDDKVDHNTQNANYAYGGGSVSGGSSGISAVSQDTSPQLGGDLDVNGFDIESPDGTDLIDITDGAIDIQTNSLSRLDITDSGVRIGGAGARVTTIENNDALGTSDTKLCTQGNAKAYADTKCTTAEAHAYVEANALTLTAELTMSGVNITTDGLVDTVDVAGLKSDFDDHSARHENGGGDEISVTGLSGLLADEQDAGKIKGVTVDDSAKADNYILKYNSASGNLEYEADVSGGGGGDLTDLDDVTISAPADNEVLAYNSGDTTWKNQTAAEAGLATSGHNHDSYYTAKYAKNARFADGTYSGGGGINKAIAHGLGETVLFVMIWKDWGSDQNYGDIHFKGQHDGNYAQILSDGAQYSRDNRMNSFTSTYFYVDDDGSNQDPNTSGTTYNWIAFSY
jgi:hypothetical protein